MGEEGASVRLSGTDPSLLRRINSAAVLRALREEPGHGALALSELAAATGLSRPTVEGVVEGLTAAGLVVEAEDETGGEHRRGRPARRFRFHAEAGHVVGVEITPHRVGAVLADLAGEVRGSVERGVAEDADAPERLAAVHAAVAELRAAEGVAADGLRAVGVGTPGIVEAGGRVRMSAALHGWSGLELGTRLQEHFGCPVRVENDANAAALGEHWRGAARGCEDVVFVLAGLSPGAGALIGGRLHRGFGGAAGEIGALHLLGRAATPERLLAVGDEPLHPLDEPAAARVLAAAGEGDARAGAAVERFVARLVHDTAALVVALDPELVVVGGLTAGLDGLLEPLRGELARYCLRPPRVAASGLGRRAVATGALRLALEELEAELYAVDQR